MPIIKGYEPPTRQLWGNCQADPIEDMTLLQPPSCPPERIASTLTNINHSAQHQGCRIVLGAWQQKFCA